MAKKKPINEIVTEVREKTGYLTLEALVFAFKSASYSNRIARKAASSIMLSEQNGQSPGERNK